MTPIYRLMKKIIPWRIMRLLILAYRKAKRIFYTTRNRINVNITRRKSQLTTKRRRVLKKGLGISFSIKWNRGFSQAVKRKGNVPKSITPYERILLDQPMEHLTIDNHSYEEMLTAQDAVIFVDSRACNDNYDFLNQLLQYNHDIRIVFKGKRDFTSFIEYRSSINNTSDLDNKRVFLISSIDAELDELVYGLSDEISVEVSTLLTNVFGNESIYTDFSQHIGAMNIAMSDRLVPWVRAYHYLVNFMEKNSIKTLYFVRNKSVNQSLLAFALAQHTEYNVFFYDKDTIEPSCSLRQIVGKGSAPIVRNNMSYFPISDYVKGKEKSVLVVGNFRDAQYRITLNTILKELNRRTNDLLIVGHTEVELDPDITAPAVSIENTPDIGTDLRRFADLVDYGLVPYVEKGMNIGLKETLFRLYIVLNFRKVLVKLLRDCYGLMFELDKSKDRISAIMSSPGRLWLSLFVSHYFSDIPSIEIQNGTLTYSRRFKKSNSDYVLAIDDFSKGVYQHMGVTSDSLFLVGSPGIDFKLNGVRKKSQQESRDFIGLSRENKVVCITTQPYGTEIMAEMVAAVAGYVSKMEEWSLLISMHHNETDDYESAYEAIFVEASIQNRASISRQDVYHNMNASDLVVTYFSTTGLEAFCLGKPVLTYRPGYNSEVPFDLVQLGVAEPFETADDIERLLTKPERESHLSTGLQRLRDGKSVERICDFVLEKSRLN